MEHCNMKCHYDARNSSPIIGLHTRIIDHLNPANVVNYRPAYA